ncbi:membrane integrity-associated transporter subunit PqiC [Pseudomonas sp. Irchel 3E20]|uniref:PqiC family protein n=1 Tax=Pseudomonas sp. Irchel 3E20 TaxID=2008983 RepID=UPI000BA43A1B|nr:PqiC family protein [Pseudomonas sp. Irchel 3E20]
MMTRSLTLAAALALSACSSAPTHYYTLIPAAHEGAVAAPAPGFEFEMQSVRIPVQVDQPQVVVRQGGGALAILETERWSAPLADELHDALALQMENKLGTRDLAGLAIAPGRERLALRTDVRRFDSLPGQYALVDVVWSLSLRGDGQPRRTLTCSSTLRQSAGVGIEALVLAHQQLVEQLATRIARTARAWVSQPTAGCS